MQDPAEKTAIARNVLALPDLIRVTDWARANREQCETLSNKTLATMAGETLSLYLTAANIASALEAVSITKVKPKAPPTLDERIVELETITAHQAQVIASLARDSEQDGNRLAELATTVTNHDIFIRALEANVKQLIHIVETLERSQLPTAQVHTGTLPVLPPPGTTFAVTQDELREFGQGSIALTATDTDVKPHSETPSLPCPA